MARFAQHCQILHSDKHNTFHERLDILYSLQGEFSRLVVDLDVSLRSFLSTLLAYVAPYSGIPELALFIGVGYLDSSGFSKLKLDWVLRPKVAANATSDPTQERGFGLPDAREVFPRARPYAHSAPPKSTPSLAITALQSTLSPAQRCMWAQSQYICMISTASLVCSVSSHAV
ncbi:hypothetical protein QE327_gp008 [Pseudomonas phage Henu5]|uniref:Uncharacterized protein n=1 Tax=Pseudomonas phage Henu5 TaxID=2499902 RepID=A0A410T811_9CAUD|nr:hypothetical protein QE327_gp008 [Pseudomonas phage Henu5]QAU05040.1 hypothetical protein Henu5_gp9 [Pseudomonas phage Henu5]